MVSPMKQAFGRTLLIVLIGSLMAVPTLMAQVLDRPVAIVRLTSTVNIGQRELRRQVELLEQQLGRQLNLDNRREVLEAQIGNVLLTQAAARDNIRVTEEEIQQAINVQKQSLGQPVGDTEFRRIIQDQMGMTWDEYVGEITDRLVQERYILARAENDFGEIAEPTTREIRQVYEENAQQFTNPAMVRFDHLFFDLRNRSNEEQQAARRQADAFARQIARGTTSFDDLLRGSLDDATYAGGDFGYILRGDPQAVQRLGSSFVNAVFDMDEGEVSGALESSAGIHIVRITDRRSPRLLELSDPLLPGESITVRQQIRAYILNQRQQEVFQQAIESVLDELMEEAEITRFEENLDW